MSTKTEPPVRGPINALRLWLPLGATGGLLYLAYMGAGEFKELQLAAKASAGAQVEILANMKELPTKEGVKSEILEALRPIDAGMAAMQAKVDALAERMTRLENNNK